MQKELIHTEEREGFTIRFYACEEDTAPEGNASAWGEPEDSEYLARIYSGELQWFCAEVTASKQGVELGTAYLGGCCYERASDFVTTDGYYPDMVSEAIEEARTTLAKLCEG